MNPFQKLIDQGLITDPMIEILVQNLEQVLVKKFGELHIKVDHGQVTDISLGHKVPKEEIQRANKK